MVAKEIIDVFVDGGEIERENKIYKYKTEFARFFSLKEAKNYYEKLKEQGLDPTIDVKKGKKINFTNLY